MENVGQSTGFKKIYKYYKNSSFEDLITKMYWMQVEYNKISKELLETDSKKDIIKDYIDQTLYLFNKGTQEILKESCDLTKNLRYLEILKNDIKLISEYNGKMSDRERNYYKLLESRNIGYRKLEEIRKYIINFIEKIEY